MENSAVEWIEGYLKKFNDIQDNLRIKKAFEIAKEMEEAQRKNDFRSGWHGNKHKDWNCEFYLIKHIAKYFKSK